MSLNKVMLIGNVGKDPEVRYLEGSGQNGAARKVAQYTPATTERYRDRNGETRENTEWHNIVAWGQPADVVERFVKKGTQLYIEGRLRTRSWTDANGAKKYTTEIAPSQGSYQRPSAPAYQAPNQYTAPSQPAYTAPSVDDNPADDLPF